MHMLWLVVFLVFFFMVFQALSDFRILGLGLRILAEVAGWIAGRRGRWAAGLGAGLVIGSLLLLAHKASASVEATNDFCELMRRAGGGAELVGSDRQFPLDDVLDAEGRCQFDTHGTDDSCMAVVSVMENRISLADYRADVSVDPNAQGLSQTLVVFEHGVDACK